jgi:hypothetical protein
MNFHQVLRIACTLSALAAAADAGADVFLIANPRVELSSDEVRDVFLGEKLVANGVTLAPIDNSASQAEFLSKVMSLDAAKYSSIWTKKAFRDGLNPPVVKATDAEVIRNVSKIPGAVGYVTSIPSATGIKLIKKF